jgi:hypothetical protein
VITRKLSSSVMARNTWSPFGSGSGMRYRRYYRALNRLPAKTVHLPMRAAISLLSAALLSVVAGCTRHVATSTPGAPPAPIARVARPSAKVLAEIDAVRASDSSEPRTATEESWRQRAEKEAILEHDRRSRAAEERDEVRLRAELERARREQSKSERQARDSPDDDGDDGSLAGKLSQKGGRKDKRESAAARACHPGDPLCSLDEKPDAGGRAAARVATDDKPPDGVLREVRRHYPRMEACVPRTMRDRQRALSVELMLDGHGSFRDVRVQGGDLDQGTAACIENVFFAMHIAGAEVQSVVTLPLWIRSSQ